MSARRFFNEIIAKTAQTTRAKHARHLFWFVCVCAQVFGLTCVGLILWWGGWLHGEWVQVNQTHGPPKAVFEIMGYSKLENFNWHPLCMTVGLIFITGEGNAHKCPQQRHHLQA
jgi:hypothetical protein